MNHILFLIHSSVDREMPDLGYYEKNNKMQTDENYRSNVNVMNGVECHWHDFPQ